MFLYLSLPSRGKRGEKEKTQGGECVRHVLKSLNRTIKSCTSRINTSFIGKVCLSESTKQFDTTLQKKKKKGICFLFLLNVCELDKGGAFSFSLTSSCFLCRSSCRCYRRVITDNYFSDWTAQSVLKPLTAPSLAFHSSAVLTRHSPSSPYFLLLLNSPCPQS